MKQSPCPQTEHQGSLHSKAQSSCPSKSSTQEGDLKGTKQPPSPDEAPTPGNVPAQPPTLSKRPSQCSSFHEFVQPGPFTKKKGGGNAKGSHSAAVLKCPFSHAPGWGWSAEAGFVVKKKKKKKIPLLFQGSGKKAQLSQNSTEHLQFQKETSGCLSTPPALLCKRLAS